MNREVGSLSDKIALLDDEEIARLEKCVDSLLVGDDIILVKASSALSEPAFAAVWNHPADDIYDAL